MSSYGKYVIQTERLGLRRWQEDDLESMASINRDATVMEFLPSTLARFQTEEMIEKFESHFREHGFGFYAVDWLENDEMIGFIGFQRPDFRASFTPCIEIGWRLAYHAWGRGLATEGALGCLKHGFQQLNFEEVYSFTSVRNKRSERVMEKLGMDYLGTFHHPDLERSNPLCRHVLYRLTSGQFKQDQVQKKSLFDLRKTTT